FVKWAGGLWGEVRRKLIEFAPRFGRWIVSQAKALPGKLAMWSETGRRWAGGLWGSVKGKIREFGTRVAVWAEGCGAAPPGRLEGWTDQRVVWIEGFAESLPKHLETRTQEFVKWPTGAPEETASAFEEADGPGKIEKQVENDISEERRVGKECRSGWSPYH